MVTTIAEEPSRMPDKSSSHLRLIWSQGAKDMSEAIAAEIRTICRHAAEPIHPGETVKHQIRRAWEALQRPPFWRVRSGFYGEGGTWSAAAVADFQARYRALMARRVRQHDTAKAVAQMKRGGGAPTDLELAREEYRTLIARIEAVEAALRLRGPDTPRA